MIDLSQIPFIAEISVAVTTAITATVAILFKNRKSHTAISKQLEKNGGTSLVDKVDNILDKLNGISHQLHRMETWKTAWMELTEEPIFVTDTTGHYIWINNSFAHTVGATTEDLLGLGWTKVIHPDDRDKLLLEWKSSIASLSKFDYSYRMVNIFTKETIQVRSIAKPLKDQVGSLIGYIGICYLHEDEEPTS